MIEGDPSLVHGLTKTPRLVVFGGGVALVVDDQVVGAIGVSGGSSQEDREVAEAGAAALSASLALVGSRSPRLRPRSAGPRRAAGESPPRPGSRSTRRSMRSMATSPSGPLNRWPTMNRTSASGMTSEPTGRQKRRSASPGHPLRLAVAVEPGDGLVGVEVDVPALLAHDPPEQLGQHGVLRPRRQPGVAGLRGPLVHRAPRHVDGGVGGADERRAEAVHHRGDPVLPAERGAAARCDARPAGSSWAASTAAMASPCQNSSKVHIVRNVVISGSRCAGVTSRSRR